VEPPGNCRRAPGPGHKRAILGSLSEGGMTLRRVLAGLVAVLVASVASSTTASASTPKLRALLLTAAQMPKGWSADYTPPTASGGVGCLHDTFEIRGAHQITAAEVQLSASSGLPQVEEKLVIYSVPAQQAFAKIAGVIGSCKHVSGMSAGSKMTGTVVPLSLPSYGDQSTGFDVIFKYKGLTLDEYILVVRHGDIVLGLTDGALGPPGLSQFEHYAQLALAKLPG
jgi:hypothetical protein